MSFSDTRRSQQDHVFAALHERQTSQFPDNLTVDARLEGKVELLQRFDPRVTNGAIVIHTQRLKSDPGGNLLS
ncbi:hypothetical protein ESCOMMO057M_23750 [Escherichia coli]